MRFLKSTFIECTAFHSIEPKGSWMSAEKNRSEIDSSKPRVDSSKLQIFFSFVNRPTGKIFLPKSINPLHRQRRGDQKIINQKSIKKIGF
jgi:hypothetical protein